MTICIELNDTFTNENKEKPSVQNIFVKMIWLIPLISCMVVCAGCNEKSPYGLCASFMWSECCDGKVCVNYRTCYGEGPRNVVSCDSDQVCSAGQCRTCGKAFGSGELDHSESITMTSDGGYIAAGSYGGGPRDYWILKTNSSGVREWEVKSGGGNHERLYSIQKTSDSGYIAAGFTDSYGTGEDVFVVKLNASGTVSWENNFTVSLHESAFSIAQTIDGGYIIAGESGTESVGSYDFLILKLDDSGNQEWVKTYGGASDDDRAYSIIQTSDGGFITAGTTESYGAGGVDIWILKLDATGNQEWAKALGGAADDAANEIQQTEDGGYIVAGYTKSSGAGNSDAWIIKLDSSGNQSWDKTLGGTSSDEASSIVQTTDGGYIAAGSTQSSGAGNADFWILKLDASGISVWTKTYGGTNEDVAYSVKQTSDSGYIVLGETNSYGPNPGGTYQGAPAMAMWVIKLNASGDCEW